MTIAFPRFGFSLHNWQLVFWTRRKTTEAYKLRISKSGPFVRMRESRP